jgi:integrase
VTRAFALTHQPTNFSLFSYTSRVRREEVRLARITRKGTAWYVVLPGGQWLSGRATGLRRGFTQEEAQAELERRQGAEAEATLGGYLEGWLERRRAALRATTWRSYESIVRVHVRPLLGAKLLASLRSEDLEGAYAEMLHDGRSPQLVRYTHSVLRKALNDAVKRKRLAANPAAGVELPRADRRKGRSWTRAELLRFLETAEGDELAALWLLAATTGLRKGELLGLQWGDVDLGEGVLYVRRQRVWDGTSVATSEPKTENGSRAVALGERVVAALQVSKNGHGPEDWLFERQGRGLSPWALDERFRSLCARAEVPRIRFHDLRHTHATLGLGAGVPLRVMSERLGHYDPAFTARQYQHVLDDMAREAAAKFDRHLFG